MNNVLIQYRKTLRNFSTILLMVFSSFSYAETTQCTEITSLPYTITTQGVFCFKQNLSITSVSGSALSIEANNVTIDFNGFKLENLAGTFTRGVYALDRKNITIRNGNIRSFVGGIFIDDSDENYSDTGGHVIENNRFDGNTRIAIEIEGSNNIIFRNQIRNTGGFTGTLAYATAIQFKGPSTRIINNDIDNTFSQGTYHAFGINSLTSGGSDGATAIIKGNRISQTLHSGSGVSWGIAISSNGTDHIIKENKIFNSTQEGSVAITNNGGFPGVTHLCRDNTIIHFAQGISSFCFDGGGNVTH